MIYLPTDIKVSLIVKYFLNDIDALSLFKSCKSEYSNIQRYKIKKWIQSNDLFDCKNCIITKVSFVHSMKQLQNIFKTITHLKFGETFNEKVDIHNLPPFLTHITFGSEFNQQVDNLPNSLTHVAFGHCFNQPIDNLPNFLTHVSFGHYFNQSIHNLPISVTKLTLGCRFNCSVEKLSNSICIDRACTCMIDLLPDSIRYLNCSTLDN